jgi:hypothetical protein
VQVSQRSQQPSPLGQQGVEGSRTCEIALTMRMILDAAEGNPSASNSIRGIATRIIAGGRKMLRSTIYIRFWSPGK